MSLGQFKVPSPQNEPVLSYAPGSPEREPLQAELRRQRDTAVEITPIIAGQRVATGRTGSVASPHDTKHPLGTFHKAGPAEVQRAIEAATTAKHDWARLPWEERAAVFLRAADILRGRMRNTLNAATMLGQSKTAHQAEIDSACELIDFLTFNVHFVERIMQEQPDSPTGIWNRLEYRPLDGFVFAVTPFNFTAIAGNLPTAPAMCGNTVVWKPASTALLSGHYIMALLEEAGLPPGVINFVPGSGGEVGDPVIDAPQLAGVHFTGSTATFQHLWRGIGERIGRYAQYPRVVGETGGKDFVVVHSSADLDTVATGLVRGAFEYQGQKCSAASRAYVPRDLWPALRERLASHIAEIRTGDVADFGNFMGAVIDGKSFANLKGAIDEAKSKRGAGITEILGGEYDDSTGWFVRPTILVTDDPHYRTMCEELFGPILTIYVYDEGAWEDTLRLCDGTSPYALTGAVFARDRSAVAQAVELLRHAAGNFYINDKPTGAVVGQQPFGGSRASGTNDKAGSLWNLGRWLSPRTIKETFDPARDWRYPFMG
jgi:1-pyrroline-5-carboxylate dehydrogenase